MPYENIITHDLTPVPPEVAFTVSNTPSYDSKSWINPPPQSSTIQPTSKPTHPSPLIAKPFLSAKSRRQETYNQTAKQPLIMSCQWIVYDEHGSFKEY